MRASDSGLRWLRLGLIVLASLVTYAPTWTAPFAEDDFLYLDALAHADAHRLVRYLYSEGVMDHHFRPLSDPLFFLLARTRVAYHVLLQTLHAGAACLVLFLGIGLGIDRRGALLGALVYATRDFFFPSMVWASGVSDLGSAFFVLAALVLHGAWLRARRPIVRAGSVLAFLCALLTKETAIVALALFPALQLLDETPTAGELGGDPAARRLAKRIRSVGAAVWPYLAIGIPLAAAQFSIARFEQAYGQGLYTLRLGLHSLALWPVYGLWTVFGVREALSLRTARLALDLAAVAGILTLALACVRSQGRKAEPSTALRGPRTAVVLGVGWFTLAILPALLAPNRILTNYLAIAAVGPCLCLGMVLGRLIGHATPTLRGAGWTTAALLLAAGPALVVSKSSGRIDPGGWVDPTQARRTAAALDTLATEVLPRPPADGLIVLFGDAGIQLVVLGDPDGAGFGARRMIDSAVRWRYGRSDLGAVALPPIGIASDEALGGVRDLLARFPDRVRIVEFRDEVRDLTPVARRAIDSGASIGELRAALAAG